MNRIGMAYIWSWLNQLFLGRRAVSIRPHDEFMLKNGLRFEASRRVTATDVGQVFWSIIKTGDKPIFLNTREFGYDKLGIEADIFKDATYTGGNTTPDPVYNSNDIVDPSFDFQLIAGTTLVITSPLDAAHKLVPTLYTVGPASQQSQGSETQPHGSNCIMAPNSTYALRFISNSATQVIHVRISGYNGELNTI